MRAIRWSASTTTIAGGEASVNLSTSGLAQGTYRYFARAVDNHGRWSAAAATTLTVLAADDYGNNAGHGRGDRGARLDLQARSASVGDVDWFKFQAVAGKTYVLGTQLGTLRNSVLCLYDRNGTTLLARNDDSGANLASRITWTAPASGTYYLAVAGQRQLVYRQLFAFRSDPKLGSRVGRRSPTRPCRAARRRLWFPSAPRTATAIISATPPKSWPSIPLAQKAYDLDQQLKLSQYGGSYSTNLLGAGEKYLRGGDGTWYFILPGGGLYRWGGTIAHSTLIYTFNSAYYADPSLLWNAKPGTATAVSSSNVSVSFSGNTLRDQAGRRIHQ